MTKTELEIITEILEEYAVAHGYYHAAANADIAKLQEGTENINSMKSMGSQTVVIVDLMERLGINNAKQLRAEFTRKGYERYSKNQSTGTEEQA
ncbi:hypothetical protein [Pelosinus sp. IPA-1]|uniref:hypothetical protein n=1 Tax=Pelosinus sp. IPA-1 TaxID=3029569 RepID=UPI00243627AC|nr:hypothetical protein [Pelosinus sp. IPA-1]GMB00463.1 hypothetical protein PIPA1_32620 [Pelosinus sp. IPA-1]